MSKTNDGGPAFPTYTPDQFGPDTFQGGMSLRDWFAGQALAGIVCGTQSEKMKPSGPDEAADWAFQLADAMIAARGEQ